MNGGAFQEQEMFHNASALIRRLRATNVLTVLISDHESRDESFYSKSVRACLCSKVLQNNPPLQM